MSVAKSRAPRVSIGMPVFNGASFLASALDSLLNQTHSDFELLVADNASTDATEDICCEYIKRFDGRMRYLRHASNLGSMANFRYVFEAAEGEYFMWAACDDLWDKLWIEHLVRLMDASDADMVFGKVVVIDSEGNSMRHPANNASFRYRGPALLRRLWFFLQYERLGKANTLYALFRRRVFPSLSCALGECESGAMRYDYSVIYSMLKRGRLEAENTVAMKKRYHYDSLGEDMARQTETKSVFRKFIKAIVNPYPPGLIAEYFHYSSNWERLLLAMLLPVKLLLAYRGQLVSFLRSSGSQHSMHPTAT